MVKGCDLLDGHLLAGGLVYRGAVELYQQRRPCKTKLRREADSPDNTVCSLADDILNIILLAHVKGDLAGARRVRRLGSRHCGGLWPRQAWLLAATTDQLVRPGRSTEDRLSGIRIDDVKTNWPRGRCHGEIAQRGCPKQRPVRPGRGTVEVVSVAARALLCSRLSWPSDAVKALLSREGRVSWLAMQLLVRRAAATLSCPRGGKWLAAGRCLLRIEPSARN